MSTRLFGRRVVVELGTANATGKRYDGLRVSFAVKMSDDSTPNEAKIQIYNLAASTVATMQAADAVIRLLAGYDTQGGTDRLLFQGNPIDGGVKLEKRGQDRVLVVEAQDGGLEFSTSRIATSFATGTTSQQVFQALADQMGLPLGNIDAVVGDVSFPAGLVLNGKASDGLDRIAAMSGARWGIRDGTIQFWVDGESTGEEAVVFSTQAGNLIGSPTVTDTGVEVTALLAPTMRPGKPFRVQSEQVNGDYVATTVEFTGDSGFSTDFYTKAAGTPL
jgi:hypothetical protein